MTLEEAREYVIRHCNPDYPNGKTEWETAINMAIDALEKQIPKKPEKVEDRYNENLYKLTCPACGEYIAYGNSRVGTLHKCTVAPDRCGYCGQAVDFSEREKGE